MKKKSRKKEKLMSRSMNMLLTFLCLFFHEPVSSQIFQEERSIFYIKDTIAYTSKELSESLIFVGKDAILSNKENITGNIVYASTPSPPKKSKHKKIVKQTSPTTATSEKKPQSLPEKNNGKTFIIWNQNENLFFTASHLGKNITLIQDPPAAKKVAISSTHKYAITGETIKLNTYHSQTLKLYLQNKSLYIRPPPKANNSL